jgi:hypothetical protein
MWRRSSRGAQLVEEVIDRERIGRARVARAPAIRPGGQIEVVRQGWVCVREVAREPRALRDEGVVDVRRVWVPDDVLGGVSVHGAVGRPVGVVLHHDDHDRRRAGGPRWGRRRQQAESQDECRSSGRDALRSAPLPSVLDPRLCTTRPGATQSPRHAAATRLEGWGCCYSAGGPCRNSDPRSM